MLVFSPRSPNSRRNLTNYCDHSADGLTAFSCIILAALRLGGFWHYDLLCGGVTSGTLAATP